MEPQGSLPHLQVPDTCPYPEPARSSPYPIPHFLNIHPNIIFPSTSGSFQWSLSPRFPHQNPVHASPSIRATCPAHLILLHFITCTTLGEEYRTLISQLCSFLHSPVISSLLGQNTLPNTLFSNTLSLGFSLNVSDEVSRPYRWQYNRHISA